jgi:hypothetical protein
MALRPWVWEIYRAGRSGPVKRKRDEMARAAAPYVHAKISPENTKTTDNLHITLAQLVLGSYELEAAEKGKQIDGQINKQVPAE